MSRCFVYPLTLCASLKLLLLRSSRREGENELLDSRRNQRFEILHTNQRLSKKTRQDKEDIDRDTDRPPNTKQSSQIAAIPLLVSLHLPSLMAPSQLAQSDLRMALVTQSSIKVSLHYSLRDSELISSLFRSIAFLPFLSNSSSSSST